MNYARTLLLVILYGSVFGQQTDSVSIRTLTATRGTHYDQFYQKCSIATNGIPILSSHNVSDQALIQAKAIIEHMSRGLPAEVIATMLHYNFRVVVKAVSEKSTDIPEHRDLYKLNAQGNWNNTRGLGATPARPVCSCSEENLLCYQNDPYKGQDILAHEFAHGIHTMGFRLIDKTFDKRLRKIWKAAKKEKRWRNTYALTNIEEYFAYGAQTWLHVILESPVANGQHNHVNTREELRVHDPRLYRLMEGVFPVGILNVSCNCER